MNSNELSELVDSVDSLVTGIRALGLECDPFMQESIERASIAISKAHDYCKIDSLQDDTIIEVEGVSDPSPNQLAAMFLSKSGIEKSRILEIIENKMPVRITSRDESLLLTLSISQVQEMSSIADKGQCSTDVARKAIKIIEREYNPRISLEKQVRNAIEEAMDPGISALEMF